MNAVKYLESIGLENVIDEEFFNNDDKSWYKVQELMESYHQAKLKLLGIGVVMHRFFDVKGREITDGCVIWNPADKNPEQSVKLIDGYLWFGAKGTTPNENNDWCKLDKRHGTEKFWLILS